MMYLKTRNTGLCLIIGYVFLLEGTAGAFLTSLESASGSGAFLGIVWAELEPIMFKISCRLLSLVSLILRAKKQAVITPHTFTKIEKNKYINIPV